MICIFNSVFIKKIFFIVLFVNQYWISPVPLKVQRVYNAVVLFYFPRVGEDAYFLVCRDFMYIFVRHFVLTSSDRSFFFGGGAK